MEIEWWRKYESFKGFTVCLYCHTKIWKPKCFCNPKCAKEFAKMILK